MADSTVEQSTETPQSETNSDPVAAAEQVVREADVSEAPNPSDLAGMIETVNRLAQTIEKMASTIETLAAQNSAAVAAVTAAEAPDETLAAAAQVEHRSLFTGLSSASTSLVQFAQKNVMWVAAGVVWIVLLIAFAVSQFAGSANEPKMTPEGEAGVAVHGSPATTAAPSHAPADDHSADHSTSDHSTVTTATPKAAPAAAESSDHH